MDTEIKDRFGKPVVPREWFLVPLFVVNEAVERIMCVMSNGTGSPTLDGGAGGRTRRE